MDSRAPWHVVGPLLGLVIAGQLWASNRPLGALGGYIDAWSWLKGPIREIGYRGLEEIITLSLSEARSHYKREINQLLAEESLGYEFHDGAFRRPGRVQTQKALTKATTILSAPKLAGAALHFRKATAFFSKAPAADYENAVKEAVAALEAAALSLFGRETNAKDLPAILKRLEGTGAGEIPPTPVKGIETLYAFRGAAAGVAHGGATGGIVSPEVAELVLSLAASYITFLADFDAAREEPAPF